MWQKYKDCFAYSKMCLVFFLIPYCNILQKAIGSNRNYYRIYLSFLPRLDQIIYKGNIF